ncbi:ribokinase [Kribbella sp. NPDC050124]|uniref:ribokinase n=1 Tax=Kribbella sp. NPDC050124 TaxID=3364114 RepID=UPI0037A08C1A
MITVFGSVNMDLVAYAPRAPKPGETVAGRAFHTVPGGKGANQAIAAARAGGQVRFHGAVGDDHFGEDLRTALVTAGVDVEGLRQIPGPSGIAHVVVDDSGGNSIVVIPGANGAVDAGQPPDLDRASALLLQLELPITVVTQIAETADVPVILTPAPAQALPDRLIDAVTLLVPNEHEAAAITGIEGTDEMLQALLRRVPEVVITLGSRGAVYGSRSGERLQVPAVPVTAVDTTAAGDTFVGALAVARAEGMPTAEALRFASTAAALSVQKPGASTSIPTRAHIDAARATSG